jgi:hypothetical protein
MKKLIIAAIILVVVLGILFTLVGVYTDRIIDPYVKTLLEQTKPMNHRIKYKKIKVNLFQHVIKIMDVSVYPDSSMVKDENLQLDINVPTIKLTGFSIKDVLLHKSLGISDFIMTDPDVKIILPVKAPEKIIEEVRPDTARKTRAPLLNHISLERMIISGGNFQLIRNNIILASTQDINVLFQQIKLARDNRNEPIGYTYGEISVSFSNIKLYSESGLYDMSIENFSLNKNDSTVVLKGFRMIPKYDKKEFSKKLKFQNDRFDLRIGKVSIERIGFARILAGLPLHISAIHLDSIVADIYRDKNVAADLNRFPPFYNESFLKISIPVRLDTLLITNSMIRYGEMAEGNTTAGEITLDHFTLETYGLANKPVDNIIVKEMRLSIKAKVMGEGELNAELILPLEGKLHDFKCSGSVGAMKLSPLNGMVEPSMNMSFNAGKLNRMTFQFTANDNQSKGWMEFLYEGLDVRLLKKNPAKEFGFASILANAMTLSNNPSGNKDLKTVEIGFERNKNKGIINYIWKTIQSGMVRTILPIKKYQIKHKK